MSPSAIPDGTVLTDGTRADPASTVRDGSRDRAARSADVRSADPGRLGPHAARRPGALAAAAAAGRVAPVVGSRSTARPRTRSGVDRAGRRLEPVADDLAGVRGHDRAGTARRYYYVVTALDAAGNVSRRSPEASALPAAAAGRCALDGAGAASASLSRARRRRRRSTVIVQRGPESSEARARPSGLRSRSASDRSGAIRPEPTGPGAPAVERRRTQRSVQRHRAPGGRR